MQTFGGWGGRSARKRWSMGALGLALAFIVGAFVLPGEASGGTYGAGFPPTPPSGGGGGGGGSSIPGDEGGTPPKPPATVQECFEDYVRNQDRCKAIWCEPASFLWFTWTSCKDRFLNKCTSAAYKAYVCCLAGGPPCGDI